MPRPEQPRPNMDPRAKSFADSLHFDLQRVLWAIPFFIVCAVVGLVVDAKPKTIMWIAVAAAVAFWTLRSFVSWLRRSLRSDPTEMSADRDV